MAAMLNRWVWVTVSISENDLANCMAPSAASGSDPRYRVTTPAGVIPVVCRMKTSEVV